MILTQPFLQLTFPISKWKARTESRWQWKPGNHPISFTNLPLSDNTGKIHILEILNKTLQSKMGFLVCHAKQQTQSHLKVKWHEMIPSNRLSTSVCLANEVATVSLLKHYSTRNQLVINWQVSGPFHYCLHSNWVLEMCFAPLSAVYIHWFTPLLSVKQLVSH